MNIAISFLALQLTVWYSISAGINLLTGEASPQGVSKWDGGIGGSDLAAEAPPAQNTTIIQHTTILRDTDH